jgi:hypothetical protein
VFIPKGFLDDEAFALAEEAIESDIVQQILGLAPVPEEETAEPVAKPGKVAPTTVAKAVAAEPEEDEEDEADEEDEEETPPPPPVEETKKRGRPRKEPEAAAPAAKPATKPAKGALTEDSLKSLLGKIDDLAFDDI